MSGARNRDYVVSRSDHPCQRELRGSTLVLLRDLLDFRDQLQILLEVLSLKARVLPPEIVFRQIFDSLDLAGEKSPAKRAVSDKTDPESAERVEQSVLGIARPQREFGLHRADRVDLVRPANRIDRRLEKPELTTLSFR